MNDNFEIIRKTEKGYTRQPNAILRDEELTSDAKVIIYFLLSLTKSKKGYHLTTQSIISTVHISKSRVENAIELLRKTGYLSIEKVKDGTRYGGYKWLISDVPGVFRNLIFQSTENRELENPEYGNPVVRNTESTESRSTENEPVYEIQNNELSNMKKESIEIPSNEIPLHQAQGAGEVENLPVKSTSFTSGEISSVADAPSLLIKNSNQPEVISQKAYLYQQFLKKYPKKPTGMDAAATKQAFFDIPDLENIFDTIMASVDAWCNSVDWTKEGGRYITKPLNFITTKKWEETPRTIKTEIDPGLLRFITSDVEEYI